MDKVTGCKDASMVPQPARWMGHKFWLCGRRGALYTLGTDAASAFGKQLQDLNLLQPVPTGCSLLAKPGELDPPVKVNREEIVIPRLD